MEKSRFCRRIVAQINIRNSQKFVSPILIGMKLNLFFEFLTCPWVALFLIVLKIGISKKGVCPGVVRIKRNRFAKFSDGLQRKLCDQICAAKQYVQRRRV